MGLLMVTRAEQVLSYGGLSLGVAQDHFMIAGDRYQVPGNW